MAPAFRGRGYLQKLFTVPTLTEETFNYVRARDSLTLVSQFLPHKMHMYILSTTDHRKLSVGLVSTHPFQKGGQVGNVLERINTEPQYGGTFF